MQKRLVCHVAFNANNEQVGVLVSVTGRLISMSRMDVDDFRFTDTNDWDGGYITTPSVKVWKCRVKKYARAVRFQRVTLLGDN